MSIRAGQILHSMNQFVVDRIQTGGPGNLNIPQDKIYELGNYRSVGIVRDVPDLTFGLDVLDVGTEVEALLTGSASPTSDPVSTKYELLNAKPVDITSPWKTPYGEFATVRGVVIPNLALESVSYRYGLKDNAGEQFSLRGDAIYYTPGHPYNDVFLGDGTTANITFAHGPALLYRESGKMMYALSVSAGGEQLTRGTDYVPITAAPETGITLTASGLEKSNAKRISITYASALTAAALGPAATWPQDGRDPYAPAGDTTPEHLVHQGVAVKPAAIRGKDIDVFYSTLVGGVAVEVRWPDVQSFTLDWRVTLESDYEFGNPVAVAREYTDVPDVSGSIEVRPRSVEAFFNRLQQITGVPAAEIIGPQSSIVGALRVEVRNPDSGGSPSVPAGTVLKTHYLPDARFTIPGYEGRVQSKMSSTLAMTTDTGIHQVFNGPRV